MTDAQEPPITASTVDATTTAHARAAMIDLGYQTRDLTLGGVLRGQAAQRGDQVFLRFLPDGREFTCGELDRTSNRLANGLAASGISKGAHVAVMMDNSPEHLLLVFALGKIGAVCVPLNTACQGQILDYYMNQSDASAIVADTRYLDRFEAWSSGPSPMCLVVFDDGHRGHDRPPRGGGILDYQALIDASSDAPPSAEILCSDLACLSYTSGTTGPSKGNMLSHAASLAFGLSNAEHHEYRASDVAYVCLPLFHGNALQAATFGALVSGASVVLTRRFSASRFMPEVRQSGATLSNLLGSMVNFLWNQPPTAEDSDNQLRMVAAVPMPRFAAGFERRFGTRLVSNYGLSDYGMATAFTIKDPVEKLGSAGRARKNYQVRIVDEQDFELPPGEVGEIVLWTSDPWRASTGYYKLPEATLAALRNLMFHTGDRGYLDEDGYLFFVDRKKDAIRRRGENISAFEVEQILMAHPAVQEAVAFPVQADTSEDEVAVAIILDRPATERELIAYAAENMAYYMVPRFIDLRHELPRTHNQKVQKYKLRQELESRIGSVWDREKEGIVVQRRTGDASRT